MINGSPRGRPTSRTRHERGGRELAGLGHPAVTGGVVAVLGEPASQGILSCCADPSRVSAAEPSRASLLPWSDGAPRCLGRTRQQPRDCEFCPFAPAVEEKAGGKRDAPGASYSAFGGLQCWAAAASPLRPWGILSPARQLQLLRSCSADRGPVLPRDVARRGALHRPKLVGQPGAGIPSRSAAGARQIIKNCLCAPFGRLS